MFVKFYLFSSPLIEKIKSNSYVVSPLPGVKEGISGSIVTGYNVGVNNYISEERKKASIEVINYMASKNFQKKYVKNDIIIS